MNLKKRKGEKDTQQPKAQLLGGEEFSGGEREYRDKVITQREKYSRGWRREMRIMTLCRGKSVCA